MEFTIECEEFARVIALVKGVVPTRNTIPILNNILIEASGRSISVFGTCMEMEATAVATGEVITEGSTTIPASVLLSIVKALPKKSLATLKVTDERAVLTCGRSKYDLRTLSPAGFPVMSKLDDDGITFSIGAKAFGALFETTRCAMLHTADRPYLGGVQLTADDGLLIATATDAHRLVRRTTELPHGAEALKSSIVPADAVREIVSLLDAVDGTISVTITDHRIAISTEGASLTSRLLEANYPDCNRIIPKRNGAAVLVNASEFASAVDRALIVYSSTDTKAPAAECRTDTSGLQIHAGRASHDTASEYVAGNVIHQNSTTQWWLKAKCANLDW